VCHDDGFGASEYNFCQKLSLENDRVNLSKDGLNRETPFTENSSNAGAADSVFFLINDSRVIQGRSMINIDRR
jgi:hypothetical protein